MLDNKRSILGQAPSADVTQVKSHELLVNFVIYGYH